MEEVQSSGSHLWDLVFVDDSVGYAAGANDIMKTEDGGYTWDHITLPGMSEKKYGASISFMDSQEGVVARNDLGLWKTEDGGTTWEALTDTITGTSRRLLLNQFGMGWYLTDKQLWRATERGGERWRLIDLELPPDRRDRPLGQGIRCCYSNDFRDMHWFDREHGQHGIVVGGFQVDVGASDKFDYGRIFVTYDGGESWARSEPYQPRVTRIGGILAFQGLLWIVGSGEQLHIGYPGSWREIFPDGGPDYSLPVRYMSGWAPDLNWWFSTGFILDEQTGWTAGTRILHTTDGGETWTVEYGPYKKRTPDWVYHGWIRRMERAGNNLIAVGWHGQILMRSIDDIPTSVRPASWGTVKKEVGRRID